MAKYTFPANRGVRSTTIVDHSKPAGTAPVTKAASTSGRVQITAEDVKDPERLVKVLSDIQQALDAQTHASRSNPFSSPFIARGLTFAPNETKVIPHTLGRPYTDWHVTRQVGLCASAFLTEVTLPSSAYPGLTSDKYLVLQSSTASPFFCNVTIVGD